MLPHTRRHHPPRHERLARRRQQLDPGEHLHVLGRDRSVEHVGIQRGQHRLQLIARTTNLRQHASSPSLTSSVTRNPPGHRHGEARKYLEGYQTYVRHARAFRRSESPERASRSEQLDAFVHACRPPRALVARFVERLLPAEEQHHREQAERELAVPPRIGVDALILERVGGRCRWRRPWCGRQGGVRR